MLADRPFRTLLSREILRFARVWMQTIVPTLLDFAAVPGGVRAGPRFPHHQGGKAYRTWSSSCRASRL